MRRRVRPESVAKRDLYGPAGRRHDRRDRGRVLLEVVDGSRRRRRVRVEVDDPLWTYLRTSQRRARDLSPWLAAADVVIVGEPGSRPRARTRW